MKHIILILLLSISSCKLIKEQSTQSLAKEQHTQQEQHLQQLGLNFNRDFETLHSWERLDTLGRIVERSTTRQLSHTRANVEQEQAVQVSTQQNSVSVERSEVLSRRGDSVSSLVSFRAVCVAFALGLIAGAYVLYRVRR